MKQCMYAIVFSLVIVSLSTTICSMNRQIGIEEARWHNNTNLPCSYVIRFLAQLGDSICDFAQWGAWVIYQIDIDTILLNTLSAGIIHEQRIHRNNF